MTTTRSLRQTLNLLVLLALGTQPLHAQQFTHKAKVNPVPESGFYRIPLSPTMAAYAQANWQDLRLFNAKGKEVPFLLKAESPYKVDEDYVAFNIASNSSTNELQTLVIENPTKKKINRFLLDMSNTETDRTIRISGSNNNNEWFSVIDSVSFTMWGQTNESTVRQSISFPYSQFAYYKIDIKKLNKEPLNITQVGFSRDTVHVPAYQRVPGMRYTTQQEGTITRIQISVEPRNLIDQLQFFIREPKQYQREVSIKAPRANYNRKEYTLSRSKNRRNGDMDETILTLSSTEGGNLFTKFMLGEAHQTNVTLEIENNNNPPLQIDSVVAYQLNTSICAELEAGSTYFMYMGDSNLKAPLYDLVYFEKKIPNVLPNATVGDLQLKSEAATGEFNAQQERYMVWAGMGILALFLLFITRNLMKKIDN